MLKNHAFYIKGSPSLSDMALANKGAQNDSRGFKSPAKHQAAARRVR